jgi:hypothetical protein
MDNYWVLVRTAAFFERNNQYSREANHHDLHACKLKRMSQAIMEWIFFLKLKATSS